VIADTDVLVDFFTDAAPFSRTIEGLIREARLAITAITVFELYAGVRGTKRLRQIEALCESVPVFALDILAAAYAGKIYTELRSKGITIGNQDILIAGICLAGGLPLLTRNKPHFSPVKGLTLF
jgi:predicted nucleic acid-binding protein